ncbi:MAG: immunoglobulin domain-containing protein [Opitutaceae bacterium]|nr:immunoglobulin domain-containing protein [Opitutaceae bacterium]
MKPILLLSSACLLLTAPLAHAQLKWSAYDPATGGLLAGTTFEQAATFDPATNSYAFTIPANSAVTLVTTNLIPIDLEKPASGNVVRSISFQMMSSAGGFSTLNKYANFGLFHFPDGSAPSATSNNATTHSGLWMTAYNNGSTTYASKPCGSPNASGYSFASGSDYKLASSNILQTATGFGLGTSRAAGTGIIADDTLYDVTFRVRGNSAGTTQIGSSSSPDASAGAVWVDHATAGTNFHQAVYSSTTNNGFTCPASFNEFAFYFENGSASAVTLTLANLNGATSGGTAFLMGPAYFTTQPPSAITATSGGTLTISATPVAASVTGGPTTTYQWQLSTDGGTNYADIDAGANASAATTTLSIANVQSSHAGHYRLKAITSYTGAVSGAVSISSTSTAANVSVTSDALPPSIVTPPADTTVLVDGSTTLSVVAGGSTPLGYQWARSTDGGANYADISGATSASYTLSSAQLADTGLYRVTVTNSQGSITSAAATVTVQQGPVISGQPVGGSINPGAALTLSVTATGTPAPTYQWKRNGVTIAGATSASYAISAATGAEAGNYTVAVTNIVGSVTSATASVVVVSPSMAASSLNPAAAATGLSPDTRLTLTFNEAVSPGVSGYIRIYDAADDSVVDTVDLVAATATRDVMRAGSTLSTQNLPVQNKPIGGIANNFNYYPITVSGHTATIHPRNGVLAYGRTYYVKVDAGVFVNAAGESFAGITDATTWRFGTRASGPSAGATSLTVAPDGSGDFVTLQAALDFIPANNAVPTTIHLRNGTYFEEIGFQSKHYVTILGEDVDQTVITYPNNNTFNNVSGIYHRAVMVAQSVHDFTLANLTIRNTTPQNGSQAEAIVINGSSSTASRNMVTRCKFFSYQDTVLFNKQTYISDTVIEGDVDFMWGDGPSFFENCDIRILRTAGYFTQIRNDSSRHGFVYRNCRFTAPAGITGTFFGRIDPASFPYSEVVVLDSAIGDATNNALLATTTGISGSSYAAGWWLLNNASSAAGATTVRNWAGGNLDGTGAALNDPSSEAFTEMPTDATTQANYRDATWVLNTSIAGAVTGTWTPALAPLIVTQPASLAVDAGQPAAFSVVVVGVPAATYQWAKDGSPIVGATSATYAIASVAPSDAAGYTVTVTNTNGTVSSVAATLTVSGTVVAPTIITPPASGDVALGGSLTLTVTASGTAPLSYQWNKNGAAISGATGASYTLSGAASGDAGDYTVTVTNAGGSVTSAAATVVVRIVGLSGPSGYAGAVTGGAAGTTVTVTTAAELRSYAESTNPHTIIVSGTIDLGANGRVRPKSNKTIKGADVTATILGTVTIDGADNVILSNLNISANTGEPSTNDGVTIAASTNVLVTKCTIYDCTDGNLDVINGSDLVTISWCKFYYTRDNGHNFSNLVGSSDTDTGAGDGLTNYRVTWHHNWWSTGAMQRMIACRFGSSHMFNNYWDCSGNDYCTESRNIAAMLSEHNVYSAVDDPLGKRTALPTDVGLLMTIGNVFTNCTGSQLVSGDLVFVPPYSYELDATALVPALVQAGAGNSAVDAPAWSSASISGSTTSVAAGGSVMLTAVPSGFTPASYQWRFKNQVIAGATAATCALAAAQASDAGHYTVVLGRADGGAVVSTPFALEVQATGASVSASSTTPTAGGALTLAAAVAGVTPTGYQWQFEGVDIAGATSATYTLPHVQAFQAGTYRVVVTHAGGSITSSGTTVTVAAAPASGARVVNLSTRALAGTGDAVMIPGFFIQGTGTKRMLVRAVGPTLTRFQVDGVLANPRMVLKRFDSGVNRYVDFASNDDWGAAANAAEIASTTSGLGAFGLTSGSLDAAILADLGPGQYTVVADGADGGTGIALVELYDVDPAGATARLVNISNRGQVSTGGQIMIPGFVVSEEGSRTFLIRAVGPGLASRGVADALVDPQVVLYRRDPDTRQDYAFLTNDDWGTGPGAANTAAVAAELGAFSLASGSKDAAFIATLPPGLYTAHASGVNGAAGVALVEVYLIP